VKLALTLPPFGELADPRAVRDLAVEAEAAGWDGVFVWDHVDYRAPVEAVGDPWITIAAIAAATERVVTGPMVTPLARRRPHVVARELVALDLLSAGRLVFGVGLGLDGSGGELSRFGEETDDRRRAAMLDEGLDLVTGLLSGEHVDHAGEHYLARDARFLPPAVRGRMPIWVGAQWPHRRPLRRAARFDGVYALRLEPADVAELRAFVEPLRPGGLDGFDVVVEGEVGEDPSAWRAVGATWWLTTFDAFTVRADAVHAAITAGPPR
jgi:alkanesulfonate monooxygenase SsuD/methylene tetrahydromethanopterin reductase-like flavin-dependent oxidoreductase (luciferase family)